MKKALLLLVASLTALVMGGPAAVAAVGLLGVANDAATQVNCGPGGPAVLPLDDLPEAVAGYSGEQLTNADHAGRHPPEYRGTRPDGRGDDRDG